MELKKFSEFENTPILSTKLEICVGRRGVLVLELLEKKYD